MYTGTSTGDAARRDAWDAGPPSWANSVRSDGANVGVFQRRVGATHTYRTTSGPQWKGRFYSEEVSGQGIALLERIYATPSLSGRRE